MLKSGCCTLMLLTLSGCSLNAEPPAESATPHNQALLPPVTTEINPAQRRAIMSGERPDWSDSDPLSGFRHSPYKK